MDDATSILLPPIIAVVASLAPGTLDTLAQTIATCRPGDWSYTRAQIMQVVPQPQLRHLVGELVDTWHQQAPHIPAAQVAVMLRTAAATTQHMRQEQRVDLVWTGPTMVGVAMRRTDQALLHVITTAQHTLLIVSFAVYKIPAITEALVQAAQRGVSIRVCVEAPEPGGQTIAYDTLAALGSAVAQHAAIYLWPHDQRPTGTGGKVAALHAKCAVADARLLFVSSANLTDYALNLNMELGVLIAGGSQPQTVMAQFDALIAQGILHRVKA